MVVLAAAAIGAASYGLYKGGEAGVKKGKEAGREIKRENKRSSQRSVLSDKTKTRSERIAEIVNMKKNGSNGTNNDASAMSVPNLLHLSRANSTRSNVTAAMTLSTTSATRRQSLTETSSNVDDRHRSVMNKLKEDRQEENKKGKNKLRLSFNPFKKK